MVTIEDLHWADRSTRAFLVYLASSLCRERVLVVTTYRPDELHRRHPLRPLLAELERDARHRRVELHPLTRVELAEQLSDILGSAPGEDLLTRLFARSEGNPLFAEELLAAGTDGRGSLPPTLRDALMLRIERLSGDAQETLRLLAAGRRLDHEMLAEASGVDPRVLREALREAVAAQLVVADDEGRYAFRHALLREVVADDLLPGERAELHLALARALERRAEGLPAHGGAHLAAGIAHHYLASGDQPRALAASVRAAEAAEAVHANGEAAALYSRALQLWDRVANAEELAGRDHVEPAARRRVDDRPRARARARRDVPARGAGRARRQRSRCAPPSCSSSSPASSSTSGRSADAAETRRGALDAAPGGAERDARDPARERGQGTDARIASRGGGRRRRRGARGGARRRRRGRRAALARRHGRRAVRARPLRRGRAGAARGARALPRRRPGPGPAHARQPRRRAGRLRAAGRGPRARRRGRRAGEREGRAAPLADAAALRAGLRGRRLGRGRGGAALAGPPGDGHDLHQRRAAADRARARPRRARDRPRAARPGLRRRRRHARAAVDRAAGLAARRARAPHRRPRGRPRGDRRRAGPARLLLAGRRPDGPRGGDRRARRGRRRRPRARSRRGPVVRDRQRRRADRPRRGVRRGRPAGRGRVPRQRSRRAVARGGRRRSGPVDRGGRPPGRRSGAPTAPRRRCGARPRRCSRAASASRRRRAPWRHSPPRRTSVPNGSRRRSRASRCGRGCGWSPTSLRQRPR